MKSGRIFYFDLFLSFFSLLIFLFFSADKSILILFFSLCIYLAITKRNKLFYHLILSFILSFVWMLFARKDYSYNIEGLYFFEIRIFTLLSWTIGLFVVYLIYSHLEYLIDKKNILKKITLFAIIYWPLLLVAETVGYHIFKIRNFEGVYPGLPICNCMHAVLWMKISYFVLGIVYIILCLLLKLDNPNNKK